MSVLDLVLVGNKSGSWYSSGLFVRDRLVYSDRIAKQKMMTSVPYAGPGKTK